MNPYNVELFASDSLALYNPFAIQQILISISIVVAILLIITIYYYFSIKKLGPKDIPKGFALFIFTLIEYVKQLVHEILGPKYVKITPYFLYLFSYILLSNLLGLIGFENPTTSATVTLTMGLCTFIGTLVIAIKYQRLSFLMQFTINVKIKNKSIPVMINPLEIIGKLTPLVSISMRLWGNIFAGALIASLWFAIPIGVAQIPVSQTIGGGHPIMLVMSIFTPPLYLYLDILTGGVQAFVFVLLTMVYWKMEMKNHNEKPEIKEGTNLLAITKI
ncbi:MAG: F0F1 ATP synthase subunit A [Malacoplasma sp.]